MKTTTKVVNIHTRQPHVGNLSDFENDLTRAVRALINSEVRNYMAKGGKIVALQRKCRNEIKTVQTISRLAYYETTRPQWTTIIAVARALGITVKIGELMIRYGVEWNEE